MASQRIFVWLGIAVVFAAIGGLVYLVYSSANGDDPDIGPVVVAATGPVSTPPEKPAVTDQDLPAPVARSRPKRPARVAKAPGVTRVPAAPDVADVADYGTLDEYQLSTVTPTFFGVVSGANGPLGAAVITLFEEKPSPLDYLRVGALKTDRKGQFVFQPKVIRDNTRYHLQVAHADYASRFYWNLTRGKKFDVTLETGQPLKGAVVDTDENPVAGAVVLAQGSAWREHVTAGDDGKFEFKAAPSGAIKLTAKPRFFSPKSIEGATAGSDAVKIVVERGTPVAGRVFDGTTQKPVASASISIGVPGQVDRIPMAETDGEGNYTIPGLPPTFTTFFVNAPGYSEFMLPTKIKKQKEMRFDFKVYPKGQVRGRVVDAQNEPVAGARIFVTQKNVFIYYVADPSRPSAVTDDKGNFHIDSIETNPKFDAKIVADHPDHKRGESGLIKPKPGETIEGLVIRMPAGIRFSGRVVSNVDGKGIPNAKIKFTAFGGKQAGTTVFFGSNLQSPTEAETDAEGGFSIGRLSPGRVRVEITADSHLSKQEMIEIPAGGLSGKVFQLDQGFMIAGRITDGAGKGIGNVRIHASCPHPVNSFSSGVSNQEGYYKVVNLKQGVFKLTARATGYAERTKEGVQVGEPKADFVLDQNGSISGVVSGPVGPVKEFHVNLQLQKPDGSWRWYREFPQRDRAAGKYVCNNVDPGLYKITIKTKEYAASERIGIQVTSGQETAGINFLLSAGCSIFGKLTDAVGAVPRGAHVIAQPLNQQGEPEFTAQSRTERIKDDGSYRIRGLRDGVYQVKAMAGGFCQGAGQRIVVAAQQAYQVNLVVNKGGFVKVKVVDRNGGSVGGASVYVIDAGGNRWGAPPEEPGRGKRPQFDPAEGGDSGVAGGGGMVSRTNAVGEFRIPNAICPGPATLEVSLNGVKASKQINILDEMETVERIRLGK